MERAQNIDDGVPMGWASLLPDILANTMRVNLQKAGSMKNARVACKSWFRVLPLPFVEIAVGTEHDPSKFPSNVLETFLHDAERMTRLLSLTSTLRLSPVEWSWLFRKEHEKKYFSLRNVPEKLTLLFREAAKSSTISTLDISGNCLVGVAEILSSSSSLETLIMTKCVEHVLEDYSAFFSALAMSRSLRSLSVSGCDIFKTGATMNQFTDAVLACSSITNLQAAVRQSPATEAFNAALGRLISKSVSLRTLNAAGCRTRSADPYRHVLASNTLLTSLDLSDFSSYDFYEGGIVLEFLAHNTTLRRLSFDENIVNNDHAEVFLNSLSVNSTLTSLSLREMKPSGDRSSVVCSLGNVLWAGKYLRTLSLDGVKLSSLCQQTILQALAVHAALTSLNLRAVPLVSDSVLSLAHTLQVNTILKTLNLAGTFLARHGFENFDTFAAALGTNKTLTNLSLRSCDLNLDTLRSLGRHLRQQKNLGTLSLGANQIGNEGIDAMRDVFEINKGITSLDLSYNIFGIEPLDLLAGLIANNRSLVKLNLCYSEVDLDGVFQLARAATESKLADVLFQFNWGKGVSPKNLAALGLIAGKRLSLRIFLGDVVHANIDSATSICPPPCR